MKKEDRKFLLKDLSARLPYGVKVKNIKENIIGTVFAITDMMNKKDNIVISYSHDNEDTLSFTQIEFIKPYLRPMSSMTKEEIEKFDGICINPYVVVASNFGIDFLIENHFDYQGLIPKDLALEATEDMYKY